MTPALLAAFLLVAQAQTPAAQDPRAPESICDFGVRPFDDKDLAALTKAGLDPGAKEARLFACKRRLSLDMKALADDIQRHPELDQLALRRYIVIAKYVPADDRSRTVLEGRIVSALSLLLAPKTPRLRQGAAYDDLENRWLGALPKERRDEVLRQAAYIYDHPQTQSGPPAPAAPGRRPPARCEEEVCETFKTSRCKLPLESSADRNCRGLKELMTNCACP